MTHEISPPELPSVGLAIIFIFAAAYLLVFAEERLHLRKSKPVLVASGLIWVLIGTAYHSVGRGK